MILDGPNAERCQSCGDTHNLQPLLITPAGARAVVLCRWCATMSERSLRIEPQKKSSDTTIDPKVEAHPTPSDLFVLNPENELIRRGTAAGFVMTRTPLPGHWPSGRK